MTGQRREATRLLLAFGLASLLAVGAGAAVCAASGAAPAGLWLRNLAAWGIGAAAAFGVMASFRPGFLPFVLWLAPAGLLATFVGAGQQGVHRWVEVGPLTINAAMLLLPAAAVAMAVLAAARRKTWVAVLAALALLAAQPDASQATALAAAAGLVAARTVRPLLMRFGLILAVLTFAAWAWLRPDPLAPVAEVEGVIGLAWALSPLAAAGVLAALAAAAIVPAWAAASRGTAVRLAASALTVCLLLWVITPFLGHFPVPFAGMGLSPIIGAWLGVGLLGGLMRLDA